MHSLMRKQCVLTFLVWCAVHADGPREEGIVSTAAAEKLHNTTELDYMTHIVLRMYENKKCVLLRILLIPIPKRPDSMGSRWYGLGQSM